MPSGDEVYSSIGFTSSSSNGNAFADLSVHRGHHPVFLQLNDILTAEISVSECRIYLRELQQYLDQEARRFEALPPIWQSSAYTEGVALMLEGIFVLHEVVEQTLEGPGPPENWLETALEADVFLREATELFESLR